MRRSRDYILLYARGLAMGAADVIPGVSGGTIAFITGIYDELIRSLNGVDREAAGHVLHLRWGAAWQRINGSFLVAVLAGILTSLFSLARLMGYLLAHFPVPVWAFFFGLILVSAPLVLEGISLRRPGNIIQFLAGIGVAYVITVLSPTQTPDHPLFIFACGVIAICAMILPGISGAFILLLLSKYEYMLAALASHDFLTLVIFAAGCVIGLLSFARLLRWLLDHYHDGLVSMLAGFMLGSLNKVWPWKEVTTASADSQGHPAEVMDRSIWPWDYMERTGREPHAMQALVMLVAGVCLVLVIHRIAASLSK